jgi:glycerophosphoryl diester phosphodiesterase
MTKLWNAPLTGKEKSVKKRGRNYENSMPVPGFRKNIHGEKIPTLEELIELVKGKAGLCVELKGKGTARQTVSN